MMNGTKPNGSKVTMLIRITTTDLLTQAERQSLIDASAAMYEDLLACSRISGRVEIAEIGGDIMIVSDEGGVKV